MLPTAFAVPIGQPRREPHTAAIRDRLVLWGQGKPPEAVGDCNNMGEAASSPPVWQHLGRHRYYRRDDILFWECHGPMNPQDLVTLFDTRMAVQRQFGRVFLLVDAHKNDGVPAESRRYAARFKPDPPFQGAVVVFGAGLIVRTAVTLITSASRLLGRTDLKMMFFANDEAEAWTIVERERLMMSGGQSP